MRSRPMLYGLGLLDAMGCVDPSPIAKAAAFRVATAFLLFETSHSGKGKLKRRHGR